MEITLSILFIIGLIIGAYYLAKFLIKLIDWYVHRAMVKSHIKQIKGKYVKGDFNTFHEEMKKRTWGRDNKFPNSFFIPINPEKVQRELEDVESVEEATRIVTEYNNKILKFNDTYIHADVICFDKVGLMLDYKSYNKYREFLKYHKAEHKEQDWKLSDYE